MPRSFRHLPMISAVIACYGDEPAIPVMYRRLTKVFKSLKSRYEIIFVNDGSLDRTELVLARLVARDSHLIAINHTRNFSSQMAFTSGMRQARGEVVVLLDGDLQDPPELIPQLVERWRQGYEVVYGVRIKRDESWWWEWLYKLFYRIFRLLSYVSIPVDAGDFSLLDKKVVAALLSLPERDRFIRGLRAWVGFRQIGVPYVRPKRAFGHSTNNLFKNFRWAVKGILAFSDAPLQAITLMSLTVFGLSILGIIYQVIFKLVYPTATVNGITTILVVIMFLGSVQLLSLSILGEYVGKIFEEVKQRPQYIIKSILTHRGSRKNVRSSS